MRKGNLMAIKIYLDQGHNPRDFNTGAEGNGYYEQDITYEIGKRLYALLESNPAFETKLSRPSADTILGTSNSTSLSTRVNEANRWGADVFTAFPGKNLRDRQHRKRLPEKYHKFS